MERHVRSTMACTHSGMSILNGENRATARAYHMSSIQWAARHTCRPVASLLTLTLTRTLADSNATVAALAPLCLIACPTECTLTLSPYTAHSSVTVLYLLPTC